MERVQVLLEPKQKKRANVLAEELGCSTSEVYRRALDAFSPEISQDLEGLAYLTDVLVDTNKQTTKALDQAEQKIEKALQFYRKRAAARKQKDD